MPAKRNDKTLSLTDKNTILKRLDKGESGKALAREFHHIRHKKEERTN
jgi:hypothetical protein